jgi:hypothetical protein
MTKVDKGAIRFVFVTRGRSKSFDQNEIDEFFSNTAEVEATEAKPSFKIPDTKQRKAMFLSDLRLGIKHCVSKYGATQEEIIAEANRIAPYQRLGDK